MADNSHGFFNPDEIDEQIDQYLLQEVQQNALSTVRVVQTLQHYYSTSGNYEQSLASVRKRLAQQRSSPQVVSHHSEQLSLVSLQHKGRHHMKQAYTSQHGSRFLRQLSMIAAVVCLTLIVGSMALLFHSAHQGYSLTGNVANCTMTNATPMSDRGEIYAEVDAVNSMLYRLDPTILKPLWQFQMAPVGGSEYAQISGRAVNGIYYFLGTDRDGYYYYALNAANGSLRWRFRMGTAQLQFTGNQLIMNGSVYLSEASITEGYSVVIALDASTGKIQWQHRYNGTGVALGQKHSSDYATGLQLQVGTDQTLYSTSSIIKNGVATLMLSALSAKDGTSIWQSSARTNEQIVGVNVSNCVLYISTAYNDATNHQLGHVYAYDAATGVRKWSIPLGGQPNSGTLSVLNGVIYLGSSSQSESGNVVALQAKDGSQLWKNAPQGRISAPAMAGGSIYIITSDNSEKNQMLISISAADGKVQWSRRLPHHVIPEIAPTVSGNTIYLSTAGDQVDMFRATDGSIISSIVVGDNASSNDKYVHVTITE